VPSSSNENSLCNVHITNGQQPPNVEAWNTLFSCVTFQRGRKNIIC
jgi:hypothetical protein